MANKDYGLQLDKFDSKLKFYFSLLFMTKEEFLVLKQYFGKDVNLFDFDEENLEDKDAELLIDILDNITWIYNRINITDKVLGRIFTEDEIIEGYSEYTSINSEFSIQDPEHVENFLCYLMLNKVEEKKKLNVGTIYDFFDPCSKDEIHKAIANLNGYDYEQFTMYFGINYDREVKINTNDEVRNDLLIKLYIHILNNREETDVSIILAMISKELIKEYDLYDYVRRLCNDNTLSNKDIEKIVSKLDFEDKLNIKLAYGKDYKEKKKAPEDLNFKKTITKLVKNIKEEKKKEKKDVKKVKPTTKKKTKGIEEKQKKQEKKQDKKEDNKKEEPKDKNKKEKKKEEPKKEKINIKVEVKEKKQEKKKEEPKKEPKEEKKKEEPKKEEPKKEEPKKKEENKKQRLNKFLAEHGISKKDFLLALAMLGLIEKTIVELYFGLKENDPIDFDEIANKVGRRLDAVLDLFDNATKKIVDLIKTGAINKKKIVIPVSKGFVEDNILNSYITENNPKKENISKAVSKLSPLAAAIVGEYVGINSRNKTISELAKDYNYSEKAINNIINDSSFIVINELNNLEKEIKKEEPKIEKSKKEEPKIEIKKEIIEEKDKKIDKKKIENAATLNDFLKATGLTKEEFNYGYKSLDSLSKHIISLYFSSYSIDEIAKECGISSDEVNIRVGQIKSKIISKAYELRKNENNMTLKKYLTENNIKLSDFNKYFSKLTPIKQTVLNLYLGLNGKSMAISDIAKKLYRSESSISEIIRSATNDLKNFSKDDNTKKNNGRLEKFLKENNITREKFNEALKSLSKTNQTVLSMYFGLNGSEKSISEIASTLNISKIGVINIISSSKMQIISLSKTNDKKKNNKSDDELINKTKEVINMMRDNPELVDVIKASNPIGYKALTILANYNVSINDLSSILGVPQSVAVNSLMDTISLANSYSKNNNKNNTGFYYNDVGSKDKDKAK